jgi:hypothetical protein
MPGTLRLANQPALEALGSHPKTAGCPFERSRQRYKASLLDEAGTRRARFPTCTTRLAVMSPTKDELIGLLDYRSEQEIETNLAKGIYGADKRPLAELVLARKKLARVEAQRTEEMRIARSATEAAWESAKEAKGANTRATWALIMSIASLAIAVSVLIFKD